MVRLALRLIIGLLGALAVLLAVRIWFDPAMPAAQLGLSAQGGLGLATLRADVGGFFAGMGIFALAGALRDDRRLLTAPLLLVGLALAGRVVTMAVEGLQQPMVMPMVVEAALAVLLATGRRTLGRRP